MNSEDTNSIKYILKEMDPAERVEFEREMRQNPDLRIEVESIRRINNKLDQLPVITPPDDLTTAVLEFAASHRQKRNIGSGTAYFLSATVLVLGLTTGSLMITQFFETADNPAGTTPASVQVTSQNVDQQHNDRSVMQPWTDRNNVLHLSGFESENGQARDSELLRSLNKLRPASNPGGINTFHRSIQLTNGNR